MAAALITEAATAAVPASYTQCHGYSVKVGGHHAAGIFKEGDASCGIAAESAFYYLSNGSLPNHTCTTNAAKTEIHCVSTKSRFIWHVEWSPYVTCDAAGLTFGHFHVSHVAETNAGCGFTREFAYAYLMQGKTHSGYVCTPARPTEDSATVICHSATSRLEFTYHKAVA